MQRKRTLLVITCFAALFTLFLTSCKESPSRQMTALVIGGQPEILKSGDTDWQVLNHRTIVNPGDSIRTGDDTWVYLEIDDGSLVGLTPNTQATLLTLSESSKNPVTLVDLANGLVNVRVTKELGTGSFTVHTPVMNGSVVGSKMSVEYIDELDTASVTCFEGEVNAEINYDAGESPTDCLLVSGIKLTYSSNDEWSTNFCEHPPLVKRIETDAYSDWERIYVEIEWMRQTEVARDFALTRIARFTKTPTPLPSITNTPKPTATTYFTPTITPPHMTPRPTITVEEGAPLSDAETANAGTHNYAFMATFSDNCNGETSGLRSMTITFSRNMVTLGGEGQSSQFSKVAENTYEAVDPFGEAVVMEFTSTGINAFSYCAKWVYTRN